MRVLTDSEAVRAHRKTSAVHPAESPGRLRHLRQGRRVHAAGLPLRDTTARRRYRSMPKVRADQVLRPVEPHRARQRALHPVLAVRAFHARDVEVATRWASRTAATARWCGRRRPRLRRRPVFGQRDRYLPGRCAAIAAVPAQGARLVSEADALGLPGLRRGCTVDIWHRKPEWKLNALDPRENTAIARVTPLENPAVNGPWICNKGRDLAKIFERPRAEQAMLKGKPVELDDGDRRRSPADCAPRAGRWRWCRAGDRTRSWRRSTRALAGASLRSSSPTGAATGRADRRRSADPCRQESEHARCAGAVRCACTRRRRVPPMPDLVLVWGEGFNFAALPRGVA